MAYRHAQKIVKTVLRNSRHVLYWYPVRSVRLMCGRMRERSGSIVTGQSRTTQVVWWGCSRIR